MIKQLIINGKKSYDDFDVYIGTRNISQPKKKSIKETVPFSNMVYDFSKIDGELYWDHRTLKYEFDIAELTTEEMEVAKSKLLNWLLNVHDTDIYDPYIGDYHFHGSYDSDSWTEDFEKGTITVSFSVYPYKIANNDSSVIETLEGEVTIESGSEIEDTSYSQMRELSIYGASYQETEPTPDYPQEIKTLDGIRNLVKVNDIETTTANGVTYSVKDNLITLNGKLNVEYAYGFANGIFDFVGEKNYKLSIIPVSGTWSNASIGVRRQLDTTQFYIQQRYDLTDNANSSKVITADEYGEGDGIQIYITPNATFGNFKFYIQIEEGNIEHKYVPYGGKYLRVDTFSGNYLKNLTYYGLRENGATYEIIDDYVKVIMPLKPKTWSGVYVANYGDKGTELKNLLSKLKGKTCTFSFYAKADKDRTIYYQCGTADQTYINLTTEWKRYSKTIIVDTQVPTFYCGTTYDTTTYYIKDIMLEEGDVLHEYRENGEDTILIDMTDNELVQVGDVKDELVIDGSTTKIIKKVGKVVLNGDTNIPMEINTSASQNDGCIEFRLRMTDNVYDSILMCDSFQVAYSYSSSEEQIRSRTTENGLYINIKQDRLASLDLDGFKAYLSENPITIYYQLETPVEIELTNVELPYTFNKITQITINDELDTTLDVSYNERKTLIINNTSSHRIAPTIISEGNFTITLNNQRYSVGEGTYNSGFYLETGINEVVVGGTGSIAFKYRDEVF